MNRNYIITIYNKTFAIRRFSIIIIVDTPYLFLGDIYDNDVIPKMNCVYINNKKQCILQTIKPKIEFEIDGVPKAKGRPRFRRFGKFVTTYTDKDTLKAEENISNKFKSIHNLPEIAIDTPVDMKIYCYMPIPSSISKKKQDELNSTEHTKKPDVDNLAKTVLDALNKLAYEDDSLISSLFAKKMYSTHPRTVIKISY